jgi:hypothetical protein
MLPDIAKSWQGCIPYLSYRRNFLISSIMLNWRWICATTSAAVVLLVICVTVDQADIFVFLSHYWQWCGAGAGGAEIIPHHFGAVQCCGSGLIFFGFWFGSTIFFRIRIWIRIRILRLIPVFWPQIFLNGASNCFHMCSETCTSEKKNFSMEKHEIFLLQVFDFLFFTQIFILQQCLNPNPYPNPNFFFIWIRIQIQPKHSDYFGFGATTLFWWHQLRFAFLLRLWL